MPPRPESLPRGVPGLAVLLAIVVTGIVTGAGYFRYKAPRLRRELEAKMLAAPTTAEGKLAEWHRFGAAQIHHRLTKVPPTVGGRTWIVTHAVVDPGRPDLEPEVWGIDTSELPLAASHVEGLTVVLDLPAPSLLGRARLQEEAVRNVPRHAPGEPVPDPAGRLRYVVDWFLGGLPEALERDVEGAHLVIRVGGDPPPEAPSDGNPTPDPGSTPKLDPAGGR